MTVDQSKKKRSTVLIILFILLIGAILRFYDLGMNSIWADELKSINEAKNLTSLKAFFSPSSNVHPKLYFLILHFWMKFGDEESFLRVISVIFGLLTILSTYLLGKEIYNKKIGMIAAFAVAISPFHLLYDRELRMYPLLAFLSITSLYFFIQSLRGNKKASWIMYTLITTMNIYTHYHSFLLIFAQWVYVLFSLKKYKSLIPKLIAANAISALFFLPWFVGGMLYHIQNLSPWTRYQDVFPVKAFNYILKPLYVIYGLALGQTLLPWKVVGVAGILIFIMVGLISIVKFREKLEGNSFILSVFIAVLVPGILVSYSMPRYYIFLAPLLYLFLASCIEKTQKTRFVSTLFLGILICWSVGISNYYKGRDYHILATIDPWREVGDFLSENVQKGDFVLNMGGVVLTNYYYEGPKEALPYTVGEEAFEELMKRTKNEGYNNIWLVTSNPRLKEIAEKVKKWLDEHYTLQQEKRYLHDPEYLRKSRFFRKNFLEYRISIYEYKLPK